MREGVELPDWASDAGETKNGWWAIIVDPDKAYPHFMNAYHEIGEFAPEAEPDDDLEQYLTKYWLEVFYQSVKLELQSTCGWGLDIKIKPAHEKIKMKWALTAWPDGECKEEWNRGLPAVEAATRGKEARTMFKKLKGYLPVSVNRDIKPPAAKKKRASAKRRTLGIF